MPDCVIHAMSDFLCKGVANLGGSFATSLETSALLEQGRKAAQLFLNAPDNSIVFGANMTSLTFALSRAIGRCWQPEDEVIVSALDHDANITPWRIAADEAGGHIRLLPITDEENLSLADLQQALTDKTKLVAFTLASNVTGNITPAKELIKAVHDMGALVYVDAVHYAAHHLVDIQVLNPDFLVCSAHKFCGPHLGVLYGRPELLESIIPYKVQPAPDYTPICWETGTQNFEAIAGFIACVEYHCKLSGKTLDRQALISSADNIVSHEQLLSQVFLEGCQAIPGLTIYGSQTVHNRTPTFAVTHNHKTANELTDVLAQQGIYTWAGHFYAQNLIKHYQLQDIGGFLRIGFVHYNTAEEVNRVLNALEDL